MKVTSLKLFTAAALLALTTGCNAGNPFALSLSPLHRSAQSATLAETPILYPASTTPHFRTLPAPRIARHPAHRSL